MDNALSSIQQAASFSITTFYHWFVNWRPICYPFYWNTARSCYVQQAGCLLLFSLYHWFFFHHVKQLVSVRSRVYCIKALLVLLDQLTSFGLVLDKENH